MPEIISKFVQVHIASKTEDGFNFLSLKRASHLRVYPDLWQVITGTIEVNESAIQTALREIEEETSLSIDKMWVVPTITSFYGPISDKIQLSPVFGVLVKDANQLKLSDEHQDYKWHSLKEHIETLGLLSHKNASKLFYDEIINNPNSIIPEIKI